MHTRLQAGAEFDFLTKDEMQEVFDSYSRNVGQGIRYRRTIETPDVDVTTEVIKSAGFGPDPGYCWDVKYVKSAYTNATTPGNVRWYMNAVNPSNYIAISASTATSVPIYFTSHQVFLHPGELLVPDIDAATTNPGATGTFITLVVAFVEMPLFRTGLYLS